MYFLLIFFLFCIYIKMGFDLMEWCDKNQNICIFLLALVVLQCTGYLTKILNMFGLEGFDNMLDGAGSVKGGLNPVMMATDPTIGAMAS